MTNHAARAFDARLWSGAGILGSCSVRLYNADSRINNQFYGATRAGTNFAVAMEEKMQRGDTACRQGYGSKKPRFPKNRATLKQDLSGHE